MSYNGQIWSPPTLACKQTIIENGISLSGNGTNIYSSSTILPVVTSSTISGFFNGSNGGSVQIGGQYSYPTIVIGAYNGNPYNRVTTYINGTSMTVNAGTISAGVWYFFAVTTINNGNAYLYIGAAGQTPTQLLISSSQTGSYMLQDSVNIGVNQGSCTLVSLRFWTTTALTQSQINAEAQSATPVLTSGLTYHYFNPYATTFTGLITDTVTGSNVLGSNVLIGGAVSLTSVNLSPVTDAPILTPTTWTNFSSAYGTNMFTAGNKLCLYIPQTTTTVLMGVSTNAPTSTPYTVIANLCCSSGDYSNKSYLDGTELFGLHFSDGTKYLQFVLDWCGYTSASGSNTMGANVYQWTNYVNNITNVWGNRYQCGFPSAIVNWIMAINNGSTLSFYISTDGVKTYPKHWVKMYSQAVGQFISPTKIGFGSICGNTTLFTKHYFTLNSWSVISG